MFPRRCKRPKDGKEHLYWSVVEAKRHVPYLGALNGRQQAFWRKSVELFGQDEKHHYPQQVALFPEEHALLQNAPGDLPIIRIKLSEMSLRRPRLWLACELWKQLGLDTFWAALLPASRECTLWDHVLQTLALYRLISPGSERSEAG